MAITINPPNTQYLCNLIDVEISGIAPDAYVHFQLKMEKDGEMTTFHENGACADSLGNLPLIPNYYLQCFWENCKEIVLPDFVSSSIKEVDI